MIDLDEKECSNKDKLYPVPLAWPERKLWKIGSELQALPPARLFSSAGYLELELVWWLRGERKPKNFDPKSKEEQKMEVASSPNLEVLASIDLTAECEVRRI